MIEPTPDFNKPFIYTMSWEDPAGFGIVTHDAGGRTRFGIAERYNPQMREDFWTDPPAVARDEAKWRYYVTYYVPYHLAFLSNDSKRSYVFDCLVNPGPGFIKPLQEVAAEVSKYPVEPDGIVGAETIGALSICNTQRLLEALSDARIAHYVKYSDPKYMEGLTRRAKGYILLLAETGYE